MSILSKFTKLMKNEPVHRKKTNNIWIIDESKYLSMNEVKKLRRCCQRMKTRGVRQDRFSQIRNWFMIELGLNAGLRVEEMTLLRHGDLLIEGTKCSIKVLGKGKKKRAVWISSRFKSTCQSYIKYKRSFGFDINDESFLLNNLKGTKITKRALQKFFSKIIASLNLTTHYYIHCLRHTYTTYLLRASNNNYRFAQLQLGHASIRTTQVYAGVVEVEVREGLERLYR